MACERSKGEFVLDYSPSLTRWSDPKAIVCGRKPLLVQEDFDRALEKKKKRILSEGKALLSLKPVKLTEAAARTTTNFIHRCRLFERERHPGHSVMFRGRWTSVGVCTPTTSELYSNGQTSIPLEQLVTVASTRSCPLGVFGSGGTGQPFIDTINKTSGSVTDYSWFDNFCDKTSASGAKSCKYSKPSSGIHHTGSLLTHR